MTKKKLTKNDLKLIKEIASALPKTFYPVNVPQLLTGAEITKRGVDTKGVAVLPDRLYKVNIEKVEPVNHENRLKTAFKTGGVEACYTYVTEVRSMFTDKIEGAKV